MKDRCPKGHIYDKWNTYKFTGLDGIQRRYCRECRRLANTAVRQGKLAEKYSVRYDQMMKRIKEKLDDERKNKAKANDDEGVQ